MDYLLFSISEMIGIELPLGKHIHSKSLKMVCYFKWHAGKGPKPRWSFNLSMRGAKTAISAFFLACLGIRGEVRGRADTLEGDKWQQQSPLFLPLDSGSESADWSPPSLSIIQSAIHSWPIGFPCLGLLLWVKWGAGTLLILISLSIHPHSSVNESVCQSDRFWCCRFPEQPGLCAGAGNRSLDEKLDAGFHNSSATSW